MNILRINFLIVLTFFAGCGGGDNNSETKQEKVGDIITGKWASCDFDGDSGLLDTYHFDNGSWSSTEGLYEDQSCDILKEGTIESRTGTYTIGEEVITSAGITVNEILILHSSGDVCYQIFQVVQDTMYWGLIEDFETECDSIETRPVEIDYRYSFHKSYD